MKLRNKKTGEIVVIDSFEIKTPLMQAGIESLEELNDLIKELNEEWEDYTPPEPLIKDEKIRKAVRAWAEANEVTKVYVYAIGGGEYSELYAQDNGVTDGRIKMSIKTQAGIDWGDEYTIAELCGEEEQCES